VIEPNGQHVWWKVRQGFTVVLDRDNTTGFGPEIATVGAAGAVPGIYQVFVVHYRTTVPTTSTVAITLGVGSASPYTKVFTRQTIESDARTGINVALVDIKNGIISEQFGTRPTAAADERPTPKPQ
jgi:hypothetical protein